MSLDRSDVEKIAHLARLALAEEKIAGYAKDLSNILALAEELASVDTSQVQPMAHSQALTQRLREDVVTEEDHREANQSIAPSVENGLYLVPRVIE